MKRLNQSAIYGGIPAAGTVTDVAPVSALWVNRAPLQTAPGRMVRFTDVGGGIGGVAGGLILVWNGSRWRPVGTNALLDAIDTANVGVTGTAEQQLNPNHISAPAGLFVNGDRMRVIVSASKNGTSDSATLRLRFGPTGTTADQLLTTISSLSTSNQSYNDVFEFKRNSATSIQQQGAQTFKGASASAYPPDVTVANMDVNPMFLSVTAQMANGTEIPTIQDYKWEWYSTDV